MICIEELKYKSVAIFGTGLRAARCLYFLRDREVRIKYFLNNNPNITSFCKVPVYVPSEERVKDVYILVACLESTYEELSNQLKGLGLIEFENYIYYGWLEKQIVLLHGNCHMLVIKEYLKSSNEFCNNYAIYPNPLICDNKTGIIEENVLENCDVWIHEDIRRDNAFGYYLSDEGIREKINADVLEIVIPHLFGLGKMIFPQALEVNRNNVAIANGSDTNGMFPFADKVIEEKFEKGLSTDEIISYCKGSEALREEEIILNFETYMKKIYHRECCWDIKIYDFLMTNYKKCKLFYDPNHPTNFVLGEITRRILDRLSVSDKSINTDYCLDAHEIPVYPIVKEVLQLEWNEEELRKGINGKKLISKLDFEEYIREYIWWCYEDKT